ncbi:MAG: hypothetical protein WC358_01820, partial [Ignavibacteria bacterium]
VNRKFFLVAKPQLCNAIIMKKNYFLFSIFCFLFLFGCSNKPSPEKLPLSVKATFPLLQESPQFVMYMNFKAMRTSGFWKENISDSILNAERNFGNLLYTFKLATGASISGGIDELFFSNAWLGENTIVLKGVFDKAKLDNYISKDTLFQKTVRPDGTNIYMYNVNELFFFFKDNYTLCASNYMKRIDEMVAVTDTSVNSGLMKNQNLLNAIESTVYKENIWMISTEKAFIRGILTNFMQTGPSESTTGKFEITDSTKVETDSVNRTEDKILNDMYKNINTFILSGKMKDDLKFVIQFECIDNKNAETFEKLLNGMIAIVKLSSNIKKEKKSTATENILDNLVIKSYDNSLQISVAINQKNINDFRSNTLLKKPN